MKFFHVILKEFLCDGKRTILMPSSWHSHGICANALCWRDGQTVRSVRPLDFLGHDFWRGIFTRFNRVKKAPQNKWMNPSTGRSFHLKCERFVSSKYSIHSQLVELTRAGCHRINHHWCVHIKLNLVNCIENDWRNESASGWGWGWPKDYVQ